MEKVIEIDGQKIPFKATGGTARRYRLHFGRDLIQDFYRMGKTSGGAADFENVDIQVFENMAWVMAKTADPELPPVDEWLEGFQPLSLIGAMEEILMVFAAGMETMVQSKNQIAAAGNKKGKVK